MEQNNERGFERRHGSRIWSGLVILVAGILLLAYKMGAPIPSWIFTWPMILIVIGLFIGIKSRFQNAGAFIMLAIGGIFLVDKFVPEMDFRNYIVPTILIALGLLYILKPKRNFNCQGPRDRWKNRGAGQEQTTSAFTDQNMTSPIDSVHPINPINKLNTPETAEYVDINAVFGGVKKNIFSKNFKGGEINSFMGGTEINLMQADIQEPIWLEINNVFGGTKLIVPPHWNIKNEVTAVFGGIEDKRNPGSGLTDQSKVVVLKGSCVFGGIEISNY